MKYGGLLGLIELRADIHREAKALAVAEGRDPEEAAAEASELADEIIEAWQESTKIEAKH